MVVSARSVSFPHTFSNSSHPETFYGGLKKTIGPHLTCRHRLILDTHITGWPFRACWTVFDDYDRLWDYDFYDVKGLCVQKLWPVTLSRVESRTPLAHTHTHRVRCGSARYSYSCVPSSRVRAGSSSGDAVPPCRHSSAFGALGGGCARFLCSGNLKCKNAHA